MSDDDAHVEEAMDQLGAKRHIGTIAIGVLACLSAALAMLAGCTQAATKVSTPEPPLSAMQPTEPEPFQPAAEAEAPEGPDLPAEADEEQPATGERTMVTIETEKGDMVAELFDEQMPITAGSFILLAESGFYDGLTFHRVEPNFVIQGGDPEGTGGGGPGFTIPLETDPDIEHDRGVLSMARGDDPDSAGCQFFVCLSRERCQHLDGGYAAFGRVVEGVAVASAISVGDKMTRITIDSESPHAEAAREAAKAARVQE